ncbi:MAG: amino acid decarboxylase [Lachnospiraceae bacterium]|nr:amino acid decarboxylase [Lachnospiraceae bacterium]
MIITTPIFDFINKYANDDIVRAHMPGHKGVCEGEGDFEKFYKYDITEIDEELCLYGDEGIVAQSTDSAAMLFNAGKTFYSAEGASLAIKTMVAACKMEACDVEKPVIMAARNVHRSFLDACALMDVEVIFIQEHKDSHFCKCELSPECLEKLLNVAVSEGLSERLIAVYVTSPDYLGNLQDIKELAKVCKGYKKPLLVDNAHGAYLKFFNMHPMELGAAMCADSAHKTLPVLTGGAYIHIGKDYSKTYAKHCKKALNIFASTSPSFLISASLDKCNAYLNESGEKDYHKCAEKIDNLKERLKSFFKSEEIDSFIAIEDIKEPLKLTLSLENYKGEEFSKRLRERKIAVEYADREKVVFMLSPFNRDEDYERIYEAVKEIISCEGFLGNEISNEEEKHSSYSYKELSVAKIQEDTNVKEQEIALKCIDVRRLYFSKSETVRVEDSIGKICVNTTVSCPPAVPIVVLGETITEENVKIMQAYKIKTVEVLVS